MPKNYWNLAAHVLDPGANDRIIQPIDAAEFNIRLIRLIDRKRISSQLRNNIRIDLQAAITGSLTGLYNRRYAIARS